MLTDLFRVSDCDVATDLGHQVNLIHLNTANKLFRERVLAKGKVVYLSEGYKCTQQHWWWPGPDQQLEVETDYKQKALLINVEEIEKDSPEKFIKDWLADFADVDLIQAFVARAKRLLGGE